ncbi:MAG: Gfo/Idh/MocA family oxidoreductase [Methanoregula sp.]|uniref:Gfo/Idh/MocA family protein n=1 Tax=Methanoregula sp. TaxID=2052170 RepID=UPI0025F0F9EB|nr:Gfo/Idh/MocA family oxidoreductase [Methanoregula sp.]MCK9631763.1 Gfo/Idh/MocA family oxidoreductase [Methanoregula sp.]
MIHRHFLIMGCGSVGKRHAKNLIALGCRISCFDPNHDRCLELASGMPVVQSFGNLADALSITDLDGVIICSPTAFHPEQTIKALSRGLPVLLEKPPARTAADARRMVDVMRSTGLPVLLGYTWRWWPPLARVRELVMAGRIGRILHVQFHMSAHLADWHPWEPYQDFFMASAAQGGGALLDESHWIDLMVWFFGLPEKLSGRVELISDLEIETDDNVDVHLTYPNNLRITIHLDLYGRPHEKFIRFIGEKGTILWSVEPNRIAIGNKSSQTWDEEFFSFDRNDMFMSVAREFLDVVNGAPIRTCTLDDGVRVMDIIEAIRTSSAEDRTVVLNKEPIQ